MQGEQLREPLGAGDPSCRRLTKSPRPISQSTARRNRQLASPLAQHRLHGIAPQFGHATDQVFRHNNLPTSILPLNVSRQPGWRRAISSSSHPRPCRAHLEIPSRQPENGSRDGVPGGWAVPGPPHDFELASTRVPAPNRRGLSGVLILCIDSDAPTRSFKALVRQRPGGAPATSSGSAACAACAQRCIPKYPASIVSATMRWRP